MMQPKDQRSKAKAFRSRQPSLGGRQSLIATRKCTGGGVRVPEHCTLINVKSNRNLKAGGWSPANSRKFKAKLLGSVTDLAIIQLLNKS